MLKEEGGERPSDPICPEVQASYEGFQDIMYNCLAERNLEMMATIFFQH